MSEFSFSIERAQTDDGYRYSPKRCTGLSFSRDQTLPYGAFAVLSHELHGPEQQYSPSAYRKCEHERTASLVRNVLTVEMRYPTAWVSGFIAKELGYTLVALMSGAEYRDRSNRGSVFLKRF